MGVIVRRKLHEKARKIATRNNIPYLEVVKVLRDYHKDLEEDLISDGRIVLEGLTTISIFRDRESGEPVPRGRVSNALKQKLMQKYEEETQHKAAQVSAR